MRHRRAVKKHLAALDAEMRDLKQKIKVEAAKQSDSANEGIERPCCSKQLRQEVQSLKHDFVREVATGRDSEATSGSFSSSVSDLSPSTSDDSRKADNTLPTNEEMELTPIATLYSFFKT